ncbi:MAG: 7-carboxy-7-deazaguanine synthase QueE [Campylobacterota bacterium]
MLEIDEIFGPTIQGEGKLIGSPSIFIRFSGCNFKCEGFKVEYKNLNEEIKYGCDTYYAVDKSFKNSWTRYNTYKEVINEVDKLLLNSLKIDIVITGGEPLLNWNNQEFQKLLKYYIKNNHRVTIETNSSLNIDFNESYQKAIIFSMGVKLSNCNESYKKRVNYTTIKKILNNNSHSYLKFAISENFIDDATKQIDTILDNIPKCDVYLMPIGEDTKTVQKNSLAVLDMAIKNGFIYSDRLHIRLWNNKKGV